MNIKLEQAKTADFPEIYELIKEFTVFQKTPEKFKLSLSQMLADEQSIHALVVRDSEMAIGFSTYYFGYSSWSGKHLYLDDIYIKEAYRGQGIGAQIMNNLEEIAHHHQCRSMRWLVSKWNEEAIRFYKKRGASIDATEYTCQLDF